MTSARAPVTPDDDLPEAPGGVEESLRADLEQLSYAVSHDLTAPLRAIRNFTALQDQAGVSPEKAAAYRGVVRDAAAQMGAMIEGLLAYSRVSRSTEARAAVSLDRVCDAAFAAARDRAASRGVRLERGPLPTVYGRRSWVQRLLEELVNNAVDFGAGRVHVSGEVRGAAAGRWAVVRVRDGGEGVRPEHRERAFGMFTRLRPRQDHPGQGVGLALARRIVREAGGEVSLGDAPGGGCEVRLTLPGADALGR